MKIIDITRELVGGPLYPGSIVTRLERVSDMADGAAYNCSDLHLSAHASTHCDAPLHFIPGGADTDRLPPEHFVGPCRVVTVPDGTVIGVELAAELARGTSRLLIRGGRGTHLSPEAAESVAAMGLLSIGTEALSIGSFETEIAVHTPLLRAGCAIIEQLDLSAAEDGEYFLCAAPLKISGAEGAPCRALLIDFEEKTCIK